MNNKFSFFKKTLAAIVIFIFIKVVILFFTIGNPVSFDLDKIYNWAFGAIVILFILFRGAQKSKSNTTIVRKRNDSAPPLLDNKPLHPK